MAFVLEKKKYYHFVDLELLKERLSQIPDDISESMRSMQETGLADHLSQANESNMFQELNLQQDS